MKKLLLIIPLIILIGFVGVLTSYPTSSGAMGGSVISDSLGNTNELTLGSSTDSAGYFIMLGRDSLYYDTFTGQWYLSAPLSVTGVIDGHYGFFDSLKAATHAYFGYTADSSFYMIYGLRDTVVDYDTLGGAKFTLQWVSGDSAYFEHGVYNTSLVAENATIGDDLYVTDSTYHGGAVVDSGNHWMIADTSFWTDGGADTSFIVQTGIWFEFGSDNAVKMVPNISFYQDIDGAVDTKNIQWDGEKIVLDFDADDDTCFFKAHDTGELRYIAASDQWEFTEDVVVSGDVKPAVVVSNVFGVSNTNYYGITQNDSVSWYASLNFNTSIDSLIIDSMRVVASFDADTNTVDSIYMNIRVDLDGYQGTSLWGDATDWAKGSSGYEGNTYTPNSTIAPWDRISINVKGKQMAANNDIKIYNCIWYGHYK